MQEARGRPRRVVSTVEGGVTLTPVSSTGQAFGGNDGGLVKATYGDESVDSRSLQRRLNPRAWGLDTGFRRYDDVGWPGAIFVPMTVVRAASPCWVAGLVGADRGRGG